MVMGASFYLFIFRFSAHINVTRSQTRPLTLIDTMLLLRDYYTVALLATLTSLNLCKHSGNSFEGFCGSTLDAFHICNLLNFLIQSNFR